VAVKLGTKEGVGVGANIEFSDEKGVRIGNLTFHEGRDWQVTDSSRANELGWSPYKEALSLARKNYPNG